MRIGSGWQVEKLYYACLDQMKTSLKSKRGAMLQSMNDMPDHNLSVSVLELSMLRNNRRFANDASLAGCTCMHSHPHTQFRRHLP